MNVPTHPDPTPRQVTRRSRPILLLTVGIFLLILVLSSLFRSSKSDPLAPRFIPGPAKTIRPYTIIQYSWLYDIPFLENNVWIWTGSKGTKSEYLYDLEHGAVLGELFQGTAIFATKEHSKLLVEGHGSTMTSMKDRLLSLLSKLSKGKIALPSANRVETFWVLDLKSNSARRIGEVSQFPGAGGRWHQSPGFNRGYTVPSTAKNGAEFFLADLETATFRKVNFKGRLQGWWDERRILIKDPADNFVIFDETTQTTTMLFSADTFANSLQQMGLATNLDVVAAFPNWNGHEFDFYFNAPTNWVAGVSYLLKADRTNRSLVLLDPKFQFHWGGHLDASGTHYMYDGERRAPGTGGNGGVFVVDMTSGVTRTLIPPDNKAQYAISRFNNGSIIYYTNRSLWRIDLSGSNNVQILPPASNKP